MIKRIIKLIYINEKKFIINEKEPINMNLNRNRYNNQIVKINEGNILNNIYENNRKPTVEYEGHQKNEGINATINKYKTEDKNINNIPKREDKNKINNKYISDKNINRQNIINNKAISNQQNNKNLAINKYNNNNNYNKEKDIKYFSNNKPKTSTDERLYKNSTNSYDFQKINIDKNWNLPARKISYENSYQKIQNIQLPSEKYSIKNNNKQNLNQTYNSNRIEKKSIQKIFSPQNPKYSNVLKNKEVNDYNTIIIPDMERGRDIFIRQNESNLNSGKVKTRTYVRGGKFNNVQTTYVVYSKVVNQQSNIKVNRATILDNKNKKLNKTNSDLNSKTPIKKHFIENSFVRANQNINNNCNNNDKGNPFKDYQFNSPNVGINKCSKINFNRAEENTKNHTKIIYPIKGIFIIITK